MEVQFLLRACDALFGSRTSRSAMQCNMLTECTNAGLDFSFQDSQKPKQVPYYILQIRLFLQLRLRQTFYCSVALLGLP